MRGAAGAQLRALVLGAGAGGGFPQWNCRCRNCASFWAGEAGLAPMSQSSLAVSADGENWLLLNASPDLRQQIINASQMHPRAGKRHSPIKAVLLTNGDLDHIAGLITLREKQGFDLLATEEIHSVLRANPVFEALDPEFVSRKPIALEAPSEVLPGLTVTLFAVPGKVPLFLEGEGPVDTSAVGEFTVGVEIAAAGQRLFYIPGCAALPADLAARLSGADLLFFDGTVYHDDEMIREGVGHKTGARMGHMAMAGPGGSLAAFSGLPIGRKIFIHINNTNPVLRAGSTERAAVRAAGWEIACDGLEVALTRQDQSAQAQGR
ncbi:MAG: pyrroloquinoline quinone biosynthesis protein PqqB [Neomegalonema sp.]|nr:pyrroloquinoline quinone biosynthesis protein PqqB [Neomegalonema sp.]